MSKKLLYDNPPLRDVSQRYKGTVYIGVASPEIVVGQARDSIWRMTKRPGDSEPQIAEFTKGYEAREYHTRMMLKHDFDFILHLDGDMNYPIDLLERLRGHMLPCVSGLYFRRTHDPMLPIWFEDDPTFSWPLMPFRSIPEPGRLYRLGATGAGAWLIHRSVYEAVEPLLHGENFWLEDDMDVWPHDLTKVLAGEEELRPLRMKRDRVGADARLGFFIRQAGYAIWGDAAATCGHFLPYDLDDEDWKAQGPTFHREFTEYTTKQLADLRAEHFANAASVGRAAV